MNQNNPYPNIDSEPLLNNQQRQPQHQHSPPPPPVNPYQINQNQGYVPNNQGYVPNNNQGYIPNNQGYVPNNQGFVPNNRPPVYVPNNQGFIPNNNQGFRPGTGLLCPMCRRQTDTFPKRVPGGVTWIWCFALFIFTGVCCCIPFCVDSCQDTQLVCVVCQRAKGRIQAKCC